MFVEGGRLCHGTMAQWPVQAWSRVDDDSAVAVDRQTDRQTDRDSSRREAVPSELMRRRQNGTVRLPMSHIYHRV